MAKEFSTRSLAESLGLPEDEKDVAYGLIRFLDRFEFIAATKVVRPEGGKGRGTTFFCLKEGALEKIKTLLTDNLT